MRRGIRYPDMRREVRNALAHLADREYQRRVWEEGEFPGYGKYYDWDAAVHALYDESLVAGTHRAVGDVLFDHAEANSIDEVITAIERTFEDVGDVDAPADQIVRSRVWPEVVAAASRALAMMNENG